MIGSRGWSSGGTQRAELKNRDADCERTGERGTVCQELPWNRAEGDRNKGGTDRKQFP